MTITYVCHGSKGRSRGWGEVGAGLTHPELMEFFSSFRQLYLQGRDFLHIARLLGLTQLPSNHIHAESVGGELLTLCIQGLAYSLNGLDPASYTHTHTHTCMNMQEGLC